MILGELWLLACGAAFAVLFVCSLLGIPWSLAVLLIGLAIIAILIAIRHPPSAIREAAIRAAAINEVAISAANAIDLATLILMLGYIKIATVSPPIETDYLTVWGLDAKQFFLHRGIDWHFLGATHNPNAHVDYPLLVPLVYDAAALIAGWHERMAGVITAAFGIAALLIVRGFLRDEMPKLHRALATLALMPLVFSPFIGLAEGPLIAYLLAGLLHIRKGNVTRGAIYLGLAASCKNEGVAVVAIVIVAMIVAKQWRQLPRLWPAIAIPLPWLVIARVNGFTADHLQSGVFQRLASRIANPSPIFQTMSEHPPGRLLFWLGIAAACIIGWRTLVTKERFLAVVAILMPLFFVGIYFITSRDIHWLIRWSWDRIVRQAMPVMALVALFCIAPFVIGFTHASDSRTDR